MRQPDSAGDRTLALFLLGLAAFTPPILAVFDTPETLFGMPVLYLYVFAAWAGLIALMGLSAGSRGGRSARPPAAPGADEG